MSACKALVRISLSSLQFKMQSNSKKFSSISLATPCAVSASSASLLFVSRNRGFDCMRVSSRFYAGVHGAVSLEAGDCMDGTFPCNSSSEPSEDLAKDTVEQLLSSRGDIGRLMKMERRLDIDNATHLDNQNRWFPYLDKFKSGSVFISSSEIIEALDPYILEERKERIRKVVKNRSYALCLVVEGLSDFGNASASFRSADALGFQSVHVVSCDGSKRCYKI